LSINVYYGGVAEWAALTNLTAAGFMTSLNAQSGNAPLPLWSHAFLWCNKRGPATLQGMRETRADNGRCCMYLCIFS